MQAGGADTMPTQRDGGAYIGAHPNRQWPPRRKQPVTTAGVGVTAMPTPRPPILALACGVALYAIGPGDAVVPGLWPLVERAGLATTVAPLFAIVTVGAVTAALVQPLAHVRRKRPWSAAVTMALLIVALLSPAPVVLLLAVLPVAAIAGVGGWVMLALLAAFILPPLGIVALGMAAWRAGQALRLPFAANDNRGLRPGRA